MNPNEYCKSSRVTVVSGVFPGWSSKHPPHWGTLHERSESEYIGQHFANDWTLRFCRSRSRFWTGGDGGGVGRGKKVVKLSLGFSGRGVSWELFFLFFGFFEDDSEIEDLKLWDGFWRCTIKKATLEEKRLHMVQVEMEKTPTPAMSLKP